MNLDTFTWFAVFLVLGLVVLAATVHVLATDEGLAEIRAKLRDRRGRRTTTNPEGNHHAHDSD